MKLTVCGPVGGTVGRWVNMLRVSELRACPRRDKPHMSAIGSKAAISSRAAAAATTRSAMIAGGCWHCRPWCDAFLWREAVLPNKAAGEQGEAEC